MLATSLFAGLLASVAVLASPVAKRDADLDTTILQYALTLEHLENNFYSGGLANFDATAFEQDGFPDWVRNQIVQIGQHEAQHVDFLQSALGDKAPAPCTYNYPYTDPKSFATLASIIENVGVAAYLGAANKITDPDYDTAASSILTTEARHQAWLNSAVQKESAWSGPEDTPLGFSQVYSIAASFITGCPSSNPALPFKQFPGASVREQVFNPGQTIHIDYPSSGNPEWLIIYSGLTSTANPINADASVTIPAGLQGITYAIIATVSDRSKVSDDNTVAGPLVLNFPFNSAASNA